MQNIKKKLLLLIGVNMSSTLKIHKNFSIDPVLTLEGVTFEVNYDNNFIIQNPEKFILKIEPRNNIIYSILLKIMPLKVDFINHIIIKYLNYEDIYKILYVYLKEEEIEKTTNISYNEIVKFKENINLILLKYYLNNNENSLSFCLNINFRKVVFHDFQILYNSEPLVSSENSFSLNKEETILNYYNECKKFLENNLLINTINFLSYNSHTILYAEDLDDIFNNNIKVFEKSNIKKYIINNLVFSENVLNVINKESSYIIKIIKNSNKEIITLEMNEVFQKDKRKVCEHKKNKIEKNPLIDKFIIQMKEYNNHNISCEIFTKFNIENIEINNDYINNYSHEKYNSKTNKTITIKFINHNYEEKEE